MPDWGSLLDFCAAYYATQLVRCAAFSFLLLGLVMLLRKMLFSRRTFIRGLLWSSFLPIPFPGKLNRSNRKQSGRYTGKARKIRNPICSASGTLWGEWPVRSGRWNDRGGIYKTFANYTQKTKKYGMMPKVRRCFHAKYFDC